MDLKVLLAPNPSHLEFVNPVIEGMTRASQEIRSVAGAPMQDVDKTLPFLFMVMPPSPARVSSLKP